MIGVILKREMRAYFTTPMAYIVMGLFMTITGYIFYSLLISFVENTQQIPGLYRSGLDFVNQVTIQLFTNINLFLVIFCPILTMRVFSSEKKNGVLDLYFSSPVSDSELIVAKFLSSIIKGLCLLIITIIFPIILWTLKAPDFSFVMTGYLGLFLNLTCYISLGVFASSVTSSQVVAGVITYVGILFFWMISWASLISSNYLYANIFKFISVVKHFETVTKGSISLSTIAYFLTFNIVFLVLTKVSLSVRRW